MDHLFGHRSVARAAAWGAGVGLAATAVMSAWMLLSQRLGIMGEAPPHEIVEEGADSAGVAASEEELEVAAATAHFGFGAAGGAVFGVLATLLRPGIPELLALPWALVIWFGSYFGWVPALHILPPASRDDRGRAVTMFVAHLIFGAAMGAAWRLVRRPGGVA